MAIEGRIQVNKNDSLVNTAVRRIALEKIYSKYKY